MFWGKADQITTYALRVAFSAFLCIGCINSCFAQGAPPLTVQLAGQLPGPTFGCDAGLGGNTRVYGATGAVSQAGSVGPPAMSLPALSLPALSLPALSLPALSVQPGTPIWEAISLYTAPTSTATPLCIALPTSAAIFHSTVRPLPGVMHRSIATPISAIIPRSATTLGRAAMSAPLAISLP